MDSLSLFFFFSIFTLFLYLFRPFPLSLYTPLTVVINLTNENLLVSVLSAELRAAWKTACFRLFKVHARETASNSVLYEDKMYKFAVNILFRF